MITRLSDLLLLIQ